MLGPVLRPTVKIPVRYRLFRRSRGGNFLIEDTRTGRQTSTGTSDRAAAERLLLAHGGAHLFTVAGRV